jgi:hypothetical protein
MVIHSEIATTDLVVVVVVTVIYIKTDSQLFINVMIHY